MGKVKIKRKSTFIDMTAMSDVTVLLLTFFMLTSTFLQKEPVVVNTPSSVSEEKVPANNMITVLLSPKGQVFISVTGDVDSTYSSEKMRKELLMNVVADYNKLYPNKKVSLTNKQIEAFGKLNSFGLPISNLPTYLNMPVDKQDKFQDPKINKNAGIPIDIIKRDIDKNPNEFQIWMRAFFKSKNKNLLESIKKGTGIAVKADKDTPYDIVRVLMDNLQTAKMNKFVFMTALKQGE